MIVTLSEMQKWVSDTLKQRETVLSSYAKSMSNKWAHQRIPWIRAYSNAEILKEGTTDQFDRELRLEWVLQNGTLEYNKDKSTLSTRYNYSKIYDKNNKPMPGITELKISTRGAFGSLKEFELNFQCWSQEQLDILEVLYMTPGIQVTVEWGWNYDDFNNAVVDYIPIRDSEEWSTNKFIQEVNKLREKYHGAYDAVRCLVFNFGWTVNQDGGFDCHIKAISPAETATQLSTKSMSKGRYGKYTDLDEEVQKKEGVEVGDVVAKTNLEFTIGAAYEILKDMKVTPGPGLMEIANKAGSVALGAGATVAATGILAPLAPAAAVAAGLQSLTPYSKEAVLNGSVYKLGNKIVGAKMSIINPSEAGIFDTLANTAGAIHKQQFFITWGIFEQLFITDNIGFVPAANKTQEIINAIAYINEKNKLNCKYNDYYPIPALQDLKNIDTLQIPSQYQGLVQYIPQLNSENTIINNDPYLFSCDPRVCILPGQVLKADSQGKGFITKYFEDPRNTYIFDDVVSKAGMTFATNKEKKYGYLSNIMINLKFLQECYNATDRLDDLINMLLDGVNKACGSPWNFVVTGDEDNPHMLQIIDKGTSLPLDATTQINKYLFKPYSANSIVREITISNEVENAFKGQVMLATNRTQKEGMTQVGVNPYNFYGKTTRDIAWRNFSEKHSITDPDNKDYTDNTLESGYSAIMKEMAKALDKWTDEMNDTTITDLENALNKYLFYEPSVDDQISPNYVTNPNSSIILPLKINLTIDGISGLQYGNLIDVEYIPKRYRELNFQGNMELFWIIGKTQQTIKQDDWTIQIETFPRLIKKQSTKVPKGVDVSNAIKVNTEVVGDNASSATIASDQIPPNTNAFDKINPNDEVFPVDATFIDWLMQQQVTRKIDNIQQHNTGVPNYSTWPQVVTFPTSHLVVQQNMRRFHLTRGFTDIAQQFTTTPDGMIITGRPINVIPAGVLGANSGGICIENLGNFSGDVGKDNYDRMTEQQMQAILFLTGCLCIRFNLPTSNYVKDLNKGILYHTWFTQAGFQTAKKRGDEVNNSFKPCPGLYFFGGNTVDAYLDNFKPKLDIAINLIKQTYPQLKPIK